VTKPRPTIGVFDSGFGGLTVLKALLDVIPDGDYVYFGDTARLPYGSKSVETVARYAVEASRFLEAHRAALSPVIRRLLWHSIR
jgi:glutamate racemase